MAKNGSITMRLGQQREKCKLALIKRQLAAPFSGLHTRKLTAVIQFHALRRASCGAWTNHRRQDSRVANGQQGNTNQTQPGFNRVFRNLAGKLSTQG